MASTSSVEGKSLRNDTHNYWFGGTGLCMTTYGTPEHTAGSRGILRVFEGFSWILGALARHDFSVTLP